MGKTYKRQRTKPRRHKKEDSDAKVWEFLDAGEEVMLCRICNGTRMINGELCARCGGEGYEHVEE